MSASVKLKPPGIPIAPPLNAEISSVVKSSFKVPFSSNLTTFKSTSLIIANPVLEPPIFVSPETYIVSPLALVTVRGLFVAVLAIITFTSALGTMLLASTNLPVVVSAEESIVFEVREPPITYEPGFSESSSMLFKRYAPLLGYVSKIEPLLYTVAASLAVPPSTSKPIIVTLPTNFSIFPSASLCPLIETSYAESISMVAS